MNILNYKLDTTNELLTARIGLLAIAHTNNTSNANNTNYKNNTNEVWLFSTKDHLFTQAYKLSNNWTIKHYLIDGGRDFESKISQGLSNNTRTAQRQILTLH